MSNCSSIASKFTKKLDYFHSMMLVNETCPTLSLMILNEFNQESDIMRYQGLVLPQGKLIGRLLNRTQMAH